MEKNLIYVFIVVMFQCYSIPIKAQNTIKFANKDADIVANQLSKFDGDFAEVKIKGRDYQLYKTGDLLLDNITNIGYFGIISGVKNGAYGAVNSAGKIIATFNYEEVNIIDKKNDDHPEQNYAFLTGKKDGKYALIDTTGKILLNPEYQDIEPLSASLFKMKKNGLWGWGNLKTGVILQQPIYDDVDPSYVLSNVLRITLHDSLALAKENGKMLTHFKYNYLGVCGDYQQNYFQYGTSSGKFGLMDDNCIEVTPPIYDHIEKASIDDFFLVSKNGKSGFINRKGKIVVPLKYDKIERVGDFEMLYINNLCGVMDKTGKFIIPLKKQYVEPINQQGEKLFTVNTGTDVKPTSNDQLQVFFVIRKNDGGAESDNSMDYSGLSTVRMIAIDKEKDSSSTPTVKADKALFDRNGKQLTPYVYQLFYGENTTDFPYLFMSRNNKIGLIDFEGNEIIKPIYDDVYSSDNNYGYNYNDKNNSEHNGYVVVSVKDSIGLFNLKANRLILPPIYSDINWLNDSLLTATKNFNQALFDQDGTLLAKADNSSTYNVVAPDRIIKTYEVDYNTTSELSDLKGNILYKRKDWKYKPDGFYTLLMPDSAKPNYMDNFNSEFLKVSVNGVENLFIDVNGKEKIFTPYDFVGTFYKNRAVAEKKAIDGSKTFGIIDSDGREVLPVIFDDIHSFQDGLLVIKKEGKLGLTDLTGKIFIPALYSDIQQDYYSKDFWVVAKNEKYGVIDKGGNIILPAKYQSIEPASNSITAVEENGKYGVADAGFKIIIQPVYDEIRLNYENRFPSMVRKGDWWYYLKSDGSLMNIKSKNVN